MKKTRANTSTNNYNRPGTGGGLTKPLARLKLRNDSSGQGHYGASRGSRTHNGRDYLCKKGEAVYAPVSGTVTKHGIVYNGDSKYKYTQITGGGYEFKLMYSIPLMPVGASVVSGQKIAHCQAISEKYGGSMQDHLHVEVRQGGQLVDPQSIFGKFEVS